LKKLEKDDDLSLLSGMNERKIKSLKKKGIFTIFQFLHTFQLKKKRKDAIKDEIIYYPALKALSIREKKVYINRLPQINNISNIAFIDFEGLPNENYIYLIGLIYERNNQIYHKYWWSDTKEGEVEMISEFLDYILNFNFIHLFHYGNYENRMFKKFAKRNPEFEEKVKTVLEKFKDLFPIFKNHIYLPIYRNSLKSIEKYLDIKRQGIVDGLDSIIRRKQWEQSKKIEIKEELIAYNKIDCQSLILLIKWLNDIQERLDNKEENIIDIKDLHIPSTYAFAFGNLEYINDNFKKINKASYFNYQRNKIYLRDNKRIKKGIKREAKVRANLNKPNATNDGSPHNCPNCSSSLVIRKSTTSKFTLDLRIGKFGVKKWVTQWIGGQFNCRVCFKSFIPFKLKENPYWGETLKIWAVNEYVSFNLSFQQIQQKLRETYKIKASITEISTFKRIIAEKYKHVYEQLEEELKLGNLIHTDETKALARSGKSGYVWIFTNLDT
jgi:uncharacterized protein YprB with RNaseH-like and TPR domain